MSDWELLLRWTFDGSRFEDHGVELRDLKELSLLRDALVETAKELWRAEHPERERLPRNFEQALSLKFFAVEQGSAAIPVMYKPEQPQIPLPAAAVDDTIAEKLVDAAGLLADVIAAVNSREPIPRAIPRIVLPKVEFLGSTLAADERVFVDVPGRPRAAVTEETRSRLRATALMPWTDAVDLLGEVTSASLKGRATIEVEGSPVEINFGETDEKIVTEALFRHERLALRIVGRAEFVPPDGALRKIVEVTSLSLVESDRQPTENTTPIWDLAQRIGSKIKAVDWQGVPKDGSKNVDAYLHRQTDDED